MNWRDDWYARLQGSVMPEPPLYCTACAQPMMRVERRCGFTTRGVRVIQPGYTCPTNRGWRRLVSMGIPLHDEVWADVLGNHAYWSADTYR